MPTTDPLIPSPLGLTSEQWLAVATGRARFTAAPSPEEPAPRPIGGNLAAMETYRAFYRDGVATPGQWLTRTNGPKPDATAAVPLAITVPPVVHTLREDSPEGEVVKFLTRMDRPGDSSATITDESARAAARAAAAAGNHVGTGLGRDVSHRFEHLDIESVLIPMIGRGGMQSYTLCVSSQVGCAMGCTFCETAQMGLIRSLTAGEIVAQWWNAAHVIGIRPKNIVFMGMGEPMDNLDNVLAAIDALKDHNGARIAISQVTISTVGRVDGIRRLRQHVTKPGWHRLGLALSLNAPNNADRSAIMPINRKYSLEDVRDALIDWPRYSANKVCVEYVLIPGVNDTESHAQQIADFMAPFGLCDTRADPTLGRDGKTLVPRLNGTQLMAMLNLIPYNPRRNSPWPAPTEDQVDQFLSWLIQRGVFAKRRRTKGRQMMGACGQLGAAHIRQRRLVPLTVDTSRQ